jgi:hypothetical protein
VVSFSRNSQIVRASGTRSSNPSPRNRIQFGASIGKFVNRLVDKD